MIMNEIALRKWMKIPKNIREKLEYNVFCANCKDAVHIVDYEVEMCDIGLILTGKCETCGNLVTRVIED